MEDSFFLPASSIIKWFICACRLQCSYFLSFVSYQEEWALFVFNQYDCFCKDIYTGPVGLYLPIIEVDHLFDALFLRCTHLVYIVVTLLLT